MFILIIWLQGIWLPIHGYSFSQTPLWAGISMLPLTARVPRRRAGLRLALRPVRRPPVRHRRHGGRRGLASSPLQLLPVDFAYWQFAGILLLNGIGMGLFASPNRAGIMNSLPPERRGVGGRA